MRAYIIGSLVIAGMLLAAGQTTAHHSFAAEFDANKPVTLKGVVTKVDWTNPHVWFYIDVTEADGKITTWGFSTQPPGALMRRGVTKEALKMGSVVNVEGIRARDGSNNGSMRRLTFADGTQVLTPAEGAR